jgi:hypothetical protein
MYRVACVKCIEYHSLCRSLCRSSSIMCLFHKANIFPLLAGPGPLKGLRIVEIDTNNSDEIM